MDDSSIAERSVASGVASSARPQGREGWFAGAWVQGAARQRGVPTTEGDGRRLPLRILVEDIPG